MPLLQINQTMIVTDRNERVIIWGYQESDTQVKAPLAYIASNVFYPIIELTNGVTIEIPLEYTGNTFPSALNNYIFNKIKQ